MKLVLPYLRGMDQYGDVPKRAAMGFLRRAAPVAEVCLEAEGRREGVSTLEHDPLIQGLWRFARAYVDASELAPPFGRLYDAARGLSCQSAAMLEAGVSLPRPSSSVERLIASYAEVEALLKGREVRLLIDLLVEDGDLLRAYAHERLRSLGEVDLLDSTCSLALAAAITANETPPSSYGLALKHSSSRPLPKEPVRGGLEAVQLAVRAEVTDPALLLDYAVAQFRCTSFDSYWEPRDVAEAALEALYLSAGPSPSDWGVSTQETSAVLV